MENSPFIWTLVALPVVANLIQVAVLYLFKIPASLSHQKEMQERSVSAIKELTVEVSRIADRLDVADSRKVVGQRIFSDLLGIPIDIDAIAKDWSKYPKVGKVVFQREIPAIVMLSKSKKKEIPQDDD